MFIFVNIHVVFLIFTVKKNHRIPMNALYTLLITTCTLSLKVIRIFLKQRKKLTLSFVSKNFRNITRSLSIQGKGNHSKYHHSIILVGISLIKSNKALRPIDLITPTTTVISYIQRMNSSYLYLFSKTVRQYYCC